MKPWEKLSVSASRSSSVNQSGSTSGSGMAASQPRSGWGVELDVLGIGYHAVSDEQRAAVVAAHPRPDFKNGILAAFTEGIEGRPETTFGSVKADVLAHFSPGFVRGDFVEVIKNSEWPE